MGGDKDPQPSQGGADPSVAGELHLNHQEEVSGLWDGSLQGHDAPVAVHLPHCEKALLVPAQDGELKVIPRNDTGRAHAENVKGGLEAGGEREVVGSDSQGQLLALLPVGAGQALATAARQGEEGEKKGRGLATVRSAGEELQGQGVLDSHIPEACSEQAKVLTRVFHAGGASFKLGLKSSPISHAGHQVPEHLASLENL